MKNRILFSLVVAVIPFFSFAQIDDMYFVPQKERTEGTTDKVATFNARDLRICSNNSIQRTCSE